MMSTSFGLVAALAWNEAIKKLIETYVPKGQSDVLSSFIYALIVTAAVVIITTRLARLKERFHEDDGKKEI